MTLVEEVPECPQCGLGTDIVRTQFGYRCNFCGHDWPVEMQDS